jgi:hypothetical protein
MTTYRQEQAEVWSKLLESIRARDGYRHASYLSKSIIKLINPNAEVDENALDFRAQALSVSGFVDEMSRALYEIGGVHSLYYISQREPLVIDKEQKHTVTLFGFIAPDNRSLYSVWDDPNDPDLEFVDERLLITSDAKDAQEIELANGKLTTVNNGSIAVLMGLLPSVELTLCYRNHPESTMYTRPAYLLEEALIDPVLLLGDSKDNSLEVR